MLYDTAGVVATSNVFKERTRFFLVKAAVAVMAESAVTANHAERVIYAKAVLAGTANIDIAALAAVASNSTISSGADINTTDQGVSDNDLEFSINSVYNALAGVST